ncbi:MAG: helicase-related protein [Acidobacteriota bacterium]
MSNDLGPASGEPGSMKDHTWPRFLHGPDQTLLEKLYVPALAAGQRYDRFCAYFSSSVLSAAARGFGGLITRLEALGDLAPKPAVRLLVNEELAEEDVKSLTETGDLSALETRLKKRFKTPTEALEKERLAMLGWLVQRGLLEVRVGIMRRSVGIAHAKFGIVTDAHGDALVFAGSGNESAQGLLANYEQLELSGSWSDAERYEHYKAEFEVLWEDRHADVMTVSLPEALRLQLIKFAPKESPDREPSGALERQKMAMLWRFITEAPYLANGGSACDGTAFVDLWPHQLRVVEEASAAWPQGRLLCDEVGMGKTIEAILVLRRLMAGRGVRRVLLLLPAGLLKQWQAELREKGGLLFPRMESPTTLVWPDERIEHPADLREALQQDTLLISRELARGDTNLPELLAAEPWDLVILDEAHAARRAKQEEGAFNNGTLLLDLVRQLQLKRKARGFLFLSATPMQTHPWEPWDLLSVLGEGGNWLSEFSAVRDFYEALACLPQQNPDLRTARRAATVISADASFPDSPVLERATRNADELARSLAFAPAGRRDDLKAWMRQGSPLARRMHRNTRQTLSEYYRQGRLTLPPPRRIVDDRLYDFDNVAERRVHDAVTLYIDRRFEELEAEKRGKGFVMTLYRRRASSSPLALERSLERRRQGLLRVIEQRAHDNWIEAMDQPEALDADDLPDEDVHVSSAFPQTTQEAKKELSQLDPVLDALRGLGGLDTKRDRFFDLVRSLTDDGRPVLIFTEYTDTMEYLRDRLVDHFSTGLGCYSGDGGKRWNGQTWVEATKDGITKALREGKIKALLCTDAASEGLNLQAAGALINYDLPWNPGKVEQRIGRIDRIGQRYTEVYVVNLFLKDSVDDKVYTILRQRCGLFEHFVGAMQPVLARARKMLTGQEPLDLRQLESDAAEQDRDILAQEAYVESRPDGETNTSPILTLSDLETALNALKGTHGPKGIAHPASGTLTLSVAGARRATFAMGRQALERNAGILPVSPTASEMKAVADALPRSGERLPFLVAAYRREGFRRSVAVWVGQEAIEPINSVSELRARVAAWDGTYPAPGRWTEALRTAEAEAALQVDAMQALAAKRENSALEQQSLAARLRLAKELGRYLVCLGQGTTDLNGVLYQQVQRDAGAAFRLKRCLDRLGGYPEWTTELCRELEDFEAGLRQNQRAARLMGKELDAALDDPRWGASKETFPAP